ncbi:hypothetical protein HUU40_31230 [candidate division KSB1 bacterium]|nr:hypothetical protein [candidate division KSB1 bacterium]
MPKKQKENGKQKNANDEVSAPFTKIFSQRMETTQRMKNLKAKQFGTKRLKALYGLNLCGFAALRKRLNTSENKTES